MADLYNNENTNVAEDLPWLIFTLDDKAVYTMDFYDAGIFMAGMKAFVNMNILI